LESQSGDAGGFVGRSFFIERFVMAESVILEAQPRNTRGTRHARRLRQKGMIPAVVYGHKEETLSLVVALEALERAVRHGVRVVDLKTNGSQQKALIRALQWDHLGKELLHVDFARVAMDERVVVTVPLEIRGTAPGIAAGGVLDQPLHTLSVECLAVELPGSIRVNVGELQLGSAIHVRELVLPPGVKAMADPDTVVVQVIAKQAEPEVAVAAPVAEGVEPELIGRQKAAEAEEGE
jgi:large subunit ribosomal protein L25